MTKELDSLSGRQEYPFFNKPYPVVEIHKNFIAILNPDYPDLFFKGWEQSQLCRECKGKCTQIRYKLICSNCGNVYHTKNSKIDEFTRRMLKTSVNSLIQKEVVRQKRVLYALLNGGLE